MVTREVSLESISATVAPTPPMPTPAEVASADIFGVFSAVRVIDCAVSLAFFPTFVRTSTADERSAPVPVPPKMPAAAPNAFASIVVFAFEETVRARSAFTSPAYLPSSSPMPASEEPVTFAVTTAPFSAQSATDAPATYASSVRSFSDVMEIFFAWTAFVSPRSAETALLSVHVPTVPCPATPPETEAPVIYSLKSCAAFAEMARSFPAVTVAALSTSAFVCVSVFNTLTDAPALAAALPERLPMMFCAESVSSAWTLTSPAASMTEPLPIFASVPFSPALLGASDTKVLPRLDFTSSSDAVS